MEDAEWRLQRNQRAEAALRNSIDKTMQTLEARAKLRHHRPRPWRGSNNCACTAGEGKSVIMSREGRCGMEAAVETYSDRRASKGEKEDSMWTRSIARRLLVVLTIVLLAGPDAFAKKPRPGGLNFFSKQQDIQIGQEGVREIEKKVRLCKVKQINDYIQKIGKRLAAAPEAEGYPYTFKVVWDDSINAFALPGGPTYVNTGLILAAENEAQIAGVMGHEISHVALRHGTRQASKANLLQLGMMVGGAMLGNGSIGGQLAQLGIGFGANSLLLKYSRGAERDADLLGAYIMNRAGYNPLEMARFFEKLEAQTGKRGAVAQFFSDHPNPDNRTQRIEQEIPHMPRRASYDAKSGDLDRIKALIRKNQPPPEKKTKPGAPAAGEPSASATLGHPRPASMNYRAYQGREFALTYPDNWEVQQRDNSSSVTFVPPDGLIRAPTGTAIARGVIAGVVPARRGQRVDLNRDTQRLVEQFRKGNPSIKPVSNRPRTMRVDGRQALLTTLVSNSPFPKESEIDMLLTVARPEGLNFIVFIAPQSEYRQHQPAFEKILKSVRFSN